MALQKPLPHVRSAQKSPRQSRSQCRAVPHPDPTKCAASVVPNQRRTTLQAFLASQLAMLEWIFFARVFSYTRKEVWVNAQGKCKICIIRIMTHAQQAVSVVLQQRPCAHSAHIEQ